MKGPSVQAERTGPQVQTRTVTIRGQRLRVEIRAGSGAHPPLLLLNGIGVNLETFQPFVNALNPAFDVIRFDVPGAGDSPAPLVPYPLAGHAWLVAKMLEQLGYAQVDVLGISWGGALAQQFAFQYPSRCRRLVLVSTATGVLMIPGSPLVLGKMLTPQRFKDGAYLERIAGELYGGSVRAHPEYARAFSHTPHTGSSLGYFYQLLSGAGWTSLPWLCLLRQPTLIMHGDDDPIVPLVNARILHRMIPHSQLFIFHDGHLGLVTRAEELSQVVEQFLVSAPAH